MDLDGVALGRWVGAEDMVGDLDREFLGRLAVVVDFLGERWGRSGEEGEERGGQRAERPHGGRSSVVRRGGW